MEHHPPGTQRLNIGHYFLFFLLFGTLFLSYDMMQDYLDPVIIAIILAVLGRPVYQALKVRLNHRKNLAALFSCLLLILVIIIPLTLVFMAIIRQGILSFNAINQWISAGNIERLLATPMVARGIELAQTYLKSDFIKGMDLNNVMMTVSSHAGEILVSQGRYLITNIAGVVAKFFLMTFVFFFAVQDQEKNFEYISHLIPLSSAHEKIVVDKIKSVARSALLGTLITALSQGVAGGIAFTICGLPGVFWGAVMAFASLVPVVGTALIWVPAAGWLFISGSWKSGIFMVVWSVLVVGMIDNLVRPLFMRGSGDMSTLVIFFAILGGINSFGLIGILYGPLVFGLALVLLYIYELEFHTFLKRQDHS